MFVSHGERMGGAERCLLSLVRALDRSRFSPVVVVPRGGALVAELRSVGIPVRRSLTRLWTGYNSATDGQIYLFRKGFSERVQRLARLIEHEKADVVVSNSIAILEGAFAAKLAGRPHIWNVLEMLSQDPGSIPFLPLHTVYSWLPEITNTIVAVSSSVAEEFRGFVPEAMIRTIHTGIKKPAVPESSVNVRTEFGISDDAPIFLYVGILSQRKGVHILGAAIPKVLESYPQARFLLAGKDGGMKEVLEKEFRRSGCESSVKLLGPRNDVARLVTECTAFVMPALADPLPVSVLEAMSLGKPVVATKSGGCSEMVENGLNGFLVEPNSVSDLVRGIEAVIEQPEQSKTMGQRGSERFQKEFSTEQYVNSFQSLIESVANVSHSGHVHVAKQLQLPEFPPFNVTFSTRCQAMWEQSVRYARAIRDVVTSRVPSIR